MKKHKEIEPDHQAEQWRKAAETAMIMMRFTDRGMKDWMILSLQDAGIHYPEQLLFMSRRELRSIPGIGAVAVRVIEDYRSRFLPNSQR